MTRAPTQRERDADPDENAGRAIYRAQANAEARAELARARHPVRLRPQEPPEDQP